MDVRDNHGRLIAQIENFRDANGNSVSSVTNYSNGRPVVQLLSLRSNQGQVESRTILNGKLLP